MAVATLKIGDLLDFSSPLAASMAPGNVPPQLTGTVHHRPSHYQPSETRQHRDGKSTNQISRRQIKVERETEEDKCPNVVVRNGVICTPYRAAKAEGSEVCDVKEGTMKGQEAGSNTERVIRNISAKERGKIISLLHRGCLVQHYTVCL